MGVMIPIISSLKLKFFFFEEFGDRVEGGVGKRFGDIEAIACGCEVENCHSLYLCLIWVMILSNPAFSLSKSEVWKFGICRFL